MARIIIALMSFLFPVIGFCCSCGIVSLEQKIERADYIYFGRIQESKLVADKYVENQLTILEVIKGKPETTMIRSSAAPYRNCTTYAVTGVTYIVYGKNGEIPALSFCSDTDVVLENVEFVLDELRKAANKSLQPTANAPAELNR